MGSHRHRNHLDWDHLDHLRLRRHSRRSGVRKQVGTRRRGGRDRRHLIFHSGGWSGRGRQRDLVV